MIDDLGTVRRLEDAGAAAIVMHSLFEEQVARDPFGTRYVLESRGRAMAEESSYFPDYLEYDLGPDEYLGQISAIKRAVRLPVIASLNGSTLGGWLDRGREIEQAGADALELNVYSLATDPEETALTIEDRLEAILRTVKSSLRIPVAIKLSPFHTSVANVARRLSDAGADGLVLFNRFYQPDISLEERKLVHTLRLSDPSELLLRLHWLAVLSGRIRSSLAVSGGIYEGKDAIKAVMCGAQAVQLVSALLRHGPARLGEVKAEMISWMEDHHYSSLREIEGTMSFLHCPNPKAYERANYVHVLQHWRSMSGERGREAG
jgi:dihydroorotate dehydrogenase (fumarate)